MQLLAHADVHVGVVIHRAEERAPFFLQKKIQPRGVDGYPFWRLQHVGAHARTHGYTDRAMP